MSMGIGIGGAAVLVGVSLLSCRGISAQEETSSLVPFQTEIVRRLSGGLELRPGLTLENRATPEGKDMVRAYLGEVLKSLGLEVQHQAYRENGENVFALLSSTEPSEEYVVLGAHFDTSGRSPGANDNATGCAAVLGVARYLTGLRERSRNVYVALFDEEERGLQGSGAFARKLQEEGRGRRGGPHGGPDGLGCGR